MNASPDLRHLAESRPLPWRDREAKAADYLRSLGLFAEIDERLLASDAVFSPPAELRFSVSADRTFDAQRTRHWSVVRLNDRRVSGLSSAEVLQKCASRARPVTLAHLALEGRERINALAAEVPGRLLIPGSGLITSVAGKPSFHYLIIDRIAPDEDRTVVEGPSLVLRAFDGSLDTLRSQWSMAAFVSAS